MSMVDDVLTEKDQLFTVPVGESLQECLRVLNHLHAKTTTSAGHYDGQRASGKWLQRSSAR